MLSQEIKNLRIYRIKVEIDDKVSKIVNHNIESTMFWKFSRVEQRLTEVTPFFKSHYLQEQNQSYNLEIFLRFSNIYELSKKFWKYGNYSQKLYYF